MPNVMLLSICEHLLHSVLSLKRILHIIQPNYNDLFARLCSFTNIISISDKCNICLRKYIKHYTYISTTD